MQRALRKPKSPQPHHRTKNKIRVAVCIETREGPGRERLLGIFRHALERDWELFLVRDDDMAACHQIASLQADGAILYDREPALHRVLRKLCIPLVEASARNLKLSDAAVYADDDILTGIAAEHLLSAGFEHFGYCGLTGSHQSVMRARYFQSHLAKKGGLIQTFMVEDRHDIDVSLEKPIQWLRQLPRPAGVLACDDRVAERILTACHATGVRVPDEIGVLGVGNDELMCEVAWPRLSSVSLPITEIARRAVELLEDLMAGRKLSQRDWPIAPLEVIARASTDKHATSSPIAAAAIKYIQINAHRPIGTDQVAAALQLTRRTLERHFNANTGWTVHDFLVDVRLRQAKRLLRQSDASLGDIAAHCGYQALSAFTRMFTTSAGCHPSTYRKQYREARPALPRPR